MGPGMFDGLIRGLVIMGIGILLIGIGIGLSL